METVKLEELVIDVNNSVSKMKKALVDYVNQHEGLIITDKYDTLFPIYAYIFNRYDEEEKHIILAVKTKEDKLFVLPDYANEKTGDLEGWTREEILQAPEWEDVDGDNVLKIMTLYNLCLYIEEYTT